MNAYELADALQETEPYYSTDYKLFDNAAKMLRQQADRIGVLEANYTIQVNINEKALEYISILEQVLQSIANEQVELSHDKIKWQCEDHIRWAKEALSLSGNNAQSISDDDKTLPDGK